jgi:hypothetical protein
MVTYYSRLNVRIWTCCCIWTNLGPS